MLEDTMFVFFVAKFKNSVRKRDFSINKAYLCDTSFAKLVEITENKGKKMENAVFLELKKEPLTEIFYWSDGRNEVDFVIKQGLKVKQLIQVCHDIEDYDTRMRDVGTELKAVGKVFKDVIPTFVENVKELSSVKEDLKKRHK